MKRCARPRLPGQGDFVQSQGTFRLAAQLVGPSAARTTEGRLLDDPQVLLVRRDAEHLIMGATPLSAGKECTRLSARHDPFFPHRKDADIPAWLLSPGLWQQLGRRVGKPYFAPRSYEAATPRSVSGIYGEVPESDQLASSRKRGEFPVRKRLFFGGLRRLENPPVPRNQCAGHGLDHGNRLIDGRGTQFAPRESNHSNLRLLSSTRRGVISIFLPAVLLGLSSSRFCPRQRGNSL
jgi:hypothetical protein